VPAMWLGWDGVWSKHNGSLNIWVQQNGASKHESVTYPPWGWSCYEVVMWFGGWVCCTLLAEQLASGVFT